MIARLWRGWTAPESADAYENFLRTKMFPSIHRVPGCLGAELLRREDGEEIAFVTAALATPRPQRLRRCGQPQ